MGLVIDTNIFIDAENGRFDLSSLSNLSHHGGAYIAAVSVSELLTGVAYYALQPLRRIFNTPVFIFKPDNIVFTQISARLNLDQFEV